RARKRPPCAPRPARAPSDPPRRRRRRGGRAPGRGQAVPARGTPRPAATPLRRHRAPTRSARAATRTTRARDATHPAARRSVGHTVKVDYTGWTTDGKMFDSSIPRGQPVQFPLGGVIAGWTEGLQLMVVAEKRRFWVPEELAYKGKPGKPQGMLVFDVELLDI